MSVVLPTDLLRPIIAHVIKNRDLRALSLACHTLREEAQRAMFETAAITIYASGHQRSLAFFNAIVASPNRLALAVRKLRINICGVSIEGELANIPPRQQSGGWPETIGAKIREGLQLADQMTHLRVVVRLRRGFVVASHAKHCLESLLEGCLFRLKVLVWDVPTTDLKNFILRSLENKSELNVLVLPTVTHLSRSQTLSDSKIPTLLFEICKRLRTLSASWDLIRPILGKGIVIPHLQPTGIPTVPLAYTPELRKAIGSVTHLWCRSAFQSLEFDIVDLRNMVLLQIEWLLEQEYAAIAALPKLQTLIVMDDSHSMTGPSDAITQMVEFLLRNSATLEKIYIKQPLGVTKYHPDYDCFTYIPLLDQVQMRLVYRREMSELRHQSGLDFADGVLR
ncbi:hypothetical protein D9619_007637 [Psilocybe cf. subviscida]|uniref:F-box domain-containing protein n=1 Tax=Psilocybe cf. subviscida TaxID=2480587 RepID=A0A8H5AUD1_9AGAR|nr:hypothetical protein D9619_007637 [Psilocybe cf. subviscida]